ncbi:MAG TPA: AAA family ATPase [Longimicrobiales bacterium]|nr:AAA family ATPase [Longimicrobiales bacterium]
MASHFDPDVESAPSPQTGDLNALLSSRIVGQPTALEAIIPSIQLHVSGLAPEGRPVGVFLLLGPTGTGKTRTVEALADVIHGDAHRLLRIDCGEFQGDHEVAKLIGAPPGYIGHRESKPRLTQGSLAEVTSPSSDLALVLLDEIEKAAPSLIQLLLGILDRAKLRLGDGTEVDFSNTIIFLTSNLGAREMLEEIRPSMGFDTSQPRSPMELRERLERIGRQAVRKFFPPEFLNRVDAVVAYRPLDAASVVAICDLHVAELQRHVHSRLGDRSFDIEITPAARCYIIDKGASLEYGARELKRVVHRNLTQPLAALLANGAIPPGARVVVELGEHGDRLTFGVEEGVSPPPVRPTTVLAVDDNDDLRRWMERVLSGEGYQVLAAGSVEEAVRMAGRDPPDVAVLDSMLPDGDGVTLGADLAHDFPGIGIVVVSGMDLEEEDLVMCRKHGMRVLRKPFLARELLTAIRSIGIMVARAAGAGG